MLRNAAKDPLTTAMQEHIFKKYAGTETLAGSYRQNPSQDIDAMSANLYNAYVDTMSGL